MIADLAGAELPEYDLCIIGTGPAGTTVANELRDSGLKLCALESGSRRTTQRGDRLRAVESDGLLIKDYSRERVLGGTSTTWAGLSAPLDPIDLGERAWLEHSGWPLTLEDLAPHYASAAARYRFPTLEDFGASFEPLREQGELQPGWDDVDEKVFLAASQPQNFGREFRTLYESDAIDLYLNATVLSLESDGRRVTAARVRDSRGRDMQLKARAFVVATGGIENARLLLISKLGNERDQVGRYFMNHPKNYRGVLELARPVTKAPYFFGCIHRDFAGYAGLRLSEQTQRERGLLNSYVRLEPLFPWSDSQGIEALVLLVKRSKLIMGRMRKRGQKGVVELRDYSETGDDSDLSNERRSGLAWFALIGKILADAPRVIRYLWYRLIPGKVPLIREVRLRNFMEMQPDPENRVTLSDTQDEDGRPLPRVSHRCTDLDRRSLLGLHEVLAQEVERAGVGALRSDLEAIDPWPITQDASHHLGTTRMGADPATSVVTPQLRVHGLENLYMAGGSVFPTSGCANPTFTIVALSVRLAEHLRSEVSPS